MRWPSWIPGGTSTSTVRSVVTRPSPAQTWHGCEIVWPEPPHVPHACVRMNWPNGEFETAWSRPEPPHVGHVSGVVPGSAPRAVADLARKRDRVRDLARDAFGGLDELDLGLDQDVAAVGGAARAGARAEDVLAEERREDVPEAREVEGRRPKAAAGEAVVAEAVVLLARLRLGEHLVGLGDLAEALLRVGLVGDVGVQLARKAAERLLDLRLVRGARDPQDFVVVAFDRRHGSKGTGRVSASPRGSGRA